MTDIDIRLTSLAAELDFPPTPDLLARVDVVPLRPAAARRRLLFALAAVLAVGAAVLAASPGARSAFLRVFGIGGVRIIRLDAEPPAAAARLVPLGRPVTLAEAARRVSFRIRVPETTSGRPPTRVYLMQAAGQGIVSFVWCCRRRVVLSELSSSVPAVFEKQLGPATKLERVAVVRGGDGIWLEDSDHVIRIFGVTSMEVRRVHVTGSVLIWQDGKITLRLDGELTKDEALAIARRMARS